MFLQTGALGESKENGDKHTSASVNGRQNSSFLPQNKKKPLSDIKVSREKENGDPHLSISHQLQKALPVVMFNDCEESFPGKITLQDFPNTVEGFKPAKGKIITDVKCGAFKVQVSIKKRLVCKTGVQCPTKKRCPKCHQCYSVRHIQRRYTSRSCSSQYKNVLIKELKPELPSKYEGQIMRNEGPSLKVNIVGKGITIKYNMSKKQNVIININYPQRRGKTATYGKLASNHTTKECSRPSAQFGIRLPEKQQLENKHPNSDCLHVSPVVFAVQKENFDTAVVSLCSSPEKNKPGMLSSVLDDCEVGFAISQQKDFKITQNTPQKKHVSEAETLFQNVLSPSHDTLKTTSLSDADLSKMPYEDPKDTDREREINFDIPKNITSDSYIQQITERINYFPSTNTDIIPVEDGKDYDFHSLSSLNVELTGEKATNTYCKGSTIPPAECCKNSNSISFPSSQNTLNSSMPFTPTPSTTRHSESKQTPMDTFSFDHCAKLVRGYEEEQVDVTDRDFNKATLHCDYHTNAQPLEMKSTQCPALSLASSGRLTAGSPLNSSSSRSSMEWGQTESQASHPETAGPSQTEVSVMTSITDELEQRLIIQNDEATVDSNCPTKMKSLKNSLSSRGNAERDKFLTRPLVKYTCHRGFEDLSNENHDEVCFQMDFPPKTAEFICAVCHTDNLLLIERTVTNDADQYSNQDEINLGLTSFKQEPAECQSIASIRTNSDRDKNDPKENYCPQMGILLSPQKQKTLKGTVGYTEYFTLFLHV